MLELIGSVPFFLPLFFFFHLFFSKEMAPLLFFGPFTTRGILNDILPLNMSAVAQSAETRGTSSSFSCILLIELSASKSNLSMAFSKSSSSSFDNEHFNARDVAFRENAQHESSNFPCQILVSQYRTLSLHILSIYSIYIVMAI